MKSILEPLFDSRALDRDGARQMLLTLASADLPASVRAAFLTAFRMKQLSPAELSGFREAMLDLATPVDLAEFDPVDICGTGGDGKNTFNISTLAALTAAGAGIPVAKHGNYGVSSVCGSSHVLEAVGVRFSDDPEVLRRCMREAGMCFLHAPLFHPAMKHFGPVRRELGFRTFLNLLGPLVNPARPRRRVLGVFNLEVLRNYHYVLERSDDLFFVVHSLDGHDELTLTAPMRIVSRSEDLTIHPEELGLTRLDAAMLSAGDSVQSAVEIFESVLENRSRPELRDVVAVNAALVIRCASPELSMTDAVARARASLEDGKAKQVLERLRSVNGEPSV